VSEAFLDRGRVSPLGNRKGGGGMSEFVEHEAVELGDLDEADGLGAAPGHSPPRTLADRHGTGRPRQRHRPPGVGVVLLADLNQVDGPRESRLVGVRWVAKCDEHAPFGIEPALNVVVHVLASHVYPFPRRFPIAIPSRGGRKQA
jgi:hypothetical protein